MGLLRAVGMTRSQLRSVIRWEAVIIALQGTLLGLVIGLFFGWALVRGSGHPVRCRPETNPAHSSCACATAMTAALWAILVTWPKGDTRNMAKDPLGVTELAASACWTLLRSAVVGRLAVCVDGLPDIFPVNFVVDRGTVVFRTAIGTKLAAAMTNPDVAFEVDGFHAETDEAWSVVLKGRAGKISDLQELLDTTSFPLAPWHAEPKQQFVRIEPSTVTGRRFHVADAAAWRTDLTDAPHSSPE